jgi:thiol-disulfide isomerase/thioredoxin
MRSFGIILALLLLSAGCGKKEERSPKSERNGTFVPPPPPPPSSPPPPPETKSVQSSGPIQSFTIRDIDRRESTVDFDGDRVLFRKIRQPIVMVTLFADWCPPCRGLLPYLGKLQAANSKDLFLIGLLVNSEMDDPALREFMLRHESNFFISNHPDNDRFAAYLARRYELGENYPLPLTLIFKNGRYVMSVSGAAPYEMLQNLVDQLKEKKKKE